MVVACLAASTQKREFLGRRPRVERGLYVVVLGILLRLLVQHLVRLAYIFLAGLVADGRSVHDCN